jgi:hypothetical protein
VRKLSLQSGLYYGSVHKATKILNFIHIVYMSCTNSRKLIRKNRLHYCRRFTHFIRGGIDVLDKVFYSDEAWFHLSGYVNSENSRIWSAENPNTFHETPLHSLNVRVWCAVSRRRIIGPIFFSETITAELY